ncbi:AI-2E family transporter [Membranihabitans maritimus]|uniref:AI-2E family transporter n=1 Tax=Membranihabitans maritimus TaxID=2904244 RepID=UPI001F416A4F|nr:AI-2E family transporter [Membranihabitans maritimus]
MKYRSSLFTVNQFLLFLLLLFTMLYLGRSFLIPIALGSLLAMLLVPICKKLEDWGLSRGLSAGISVLLTIVVIAGVFTVLINQIILVGEDIGSLQDRLPTMLNSFYDYVSDSFALSREQQEGYLKEQLKAAAGEITNFATLIFSSLGLYLVNFVIVITYAVLLLLYRDRLKNFVIQVVRKRSSDNVEDAADIVEKTTRVASSYIAGVFLVVLILAITNTITLYAIGLKHALFFGLTAGILNLIPYVGSLLGSLLPVVYALLTQDSSSVVVMTGIYFIIIQHVESYVLTPNIAGAKVDLSPLATIFALLLGSFIWGIAGMVVFVPILGIAKVVFDNVDVLKPYGYLIATR